MRITATCFNCLPRNNNHQLSLVTAARGYVQNIAQNPYRFELRRPRALPYQTCCNQSRIPNSTSPAALRSSQNRTPRLCLQTPPPVSRASGQQPPNTHLDFRGSRPSRAAPSAAGTRRPAARGCCRRGRRAGPASR